MNRLEILSPDFNKVHNFFFEKFSKDIDHNFFRFNEDYEYVIFKSFLVAGKEMISLNKYNIFTKNLYLLGYSQTYEYEFIENRPIYSFPDNKIIIRWHEINIKIHEKSNFEKRKINGALVPYDNKYYKYSIDVFCDLIFIFDLNFEFVVFDYLRENNTIIYYKKNYRLRKIIDSINNEIEPILFKRDTLGLIDFEGSLK